MFLEPHQNLVRDVSRCSAVVAARPDLLTVAVERRGGFADRGGEEGDGGAGEEGENGELHGSATMNPAGNS